MTQDTGLEVQEVVDYVEDEALAQIVDQMWQSYFGHVEPLLPALEPHEVPAPVLCASVGISGARPGLVTVLVEKGAAASLAAALLQEDGELTDEDVYDALGEIANIIGGNIKALVPDAGALGLPAIAEAPPLPRSNSRCAARMDANWQGHWVTFIVWLSGTGA
ncbi:chemotaxis protein CheX [Paenibacillus sp. TRM 82003]|uniref:chemotaxis protein CheX n=1 Tax=Kineococcus sp. TRM81007 TaxID=2925831 RepID=UPI001F576D28|nr:chemotaxis protein CheX [Kineococcus sp. TRM81007]MCI2238055.1 chemotaxis protein CheX [Kineococcus sp. TRM81007]MCI3926070.1 chemotaxis protein CheX [Paenibacillus sp. TRM 82003]